jgi:hypothetical protein
MSITTEQLRAALAELNGQRDVRFQFEHGECCVIRKAFTVPVEEDRIVKLTDGSREYLIDAQRVVWVEIGPSDTPIAP